MHHFSKKRCSHEGQKCDASIFSCCRPPAVSAARSASSVRAKKQSCLNPHATMSCCSDLGSTFSVFPTQFLCLKNIRTFLLACSDVFGMRKSELFESFDLFDVRDFGKVGRCFRHPLLCLSRISWETAKKQTDKSWSPTGVIVLDYCAQWFISCWDLVPIRCSIMTTHATNCVTGDWRQRFEDNQILQKI